LINPRKMLTTIAALALVASLPFSSQARADTFHVGPSGGPSITLSSTAPYDANQTVQGGNIAGSTLNSNSLPWVFCVDLAHTISPNGNYNNALATANGQVNGALVGGSLTVANQIAYLLINYGQSSLGTLEGALQGAIWTLEYGTGVVSSIGSEGSIAQMTTWVNQALLANTTGDAALVTWLTPDQTNNNVQGLVTITNLQIQAIVPEPSTFAIAGLGALAFIGYGLRRRKRA